MSELPLEVVDDLENLERAKVLLKATYEFLKKNEDDQFMVNTIHYDDAECDGLCLMDDIKSLLETMEDI